MQYLGKKKKRGELAAYYKSSEYVLFKMHVMRKCFGYELGCFEMPILLKFIGITGKHDS